MSHSYPGHRASGHESEPEPRAGTQGGGYAADGQDYGTEDRYRQDDARWEDGGQDYGLHPEEQHDPGYEPAPVQHFFAEEPASRRSRLQAEPEARERTSGTRILKESFS